MIINGGMHCNVGECIYLITYVHMAVAQVYWLTSVLLSTVTNVGVGIILYEVECRDLDSLTRSSVLFVYVGVIVAQGVIQSIMILLFTISALRQKDRAGISIVTNVIMCVNTFKYYGD